MTCGPTRCGAFPHGHGVHIERPTALLRVFSWEGAEPRAAQARRRLPPRALRALWQTHLEEARLSKLTDWVEETIEETFIFRRQLLQHH